MIRIAHISDTHITGESAYKGYAYDLIANEVNRLNFDFVVHTGDVTNNGTAEEAERAAAILRGLKPRLAIVPGNHDRRDTLAAAFGERICPRDAHGFIQHDIRLPGLRLLGLDTTAPGVPGGVFDAPRAAWLEARLQEAPDTPTVLFMHHPPAHFGVIETELDGFQGVEHLAEIVRAHPQVTRILAGHIHLASLTTWQGIAVSTAPSTGMRLYLDLTLTRSAYILDEPAYHLHFWQEGQGLVTHTVRVLPEETLHPFAPEP